MNEKKVLLTIGQVRIKDYDSMNVVVERFESVYVPKTKETTQKWVFKGYSRSILAALLKVQRDELLIEKDSINGIDDYLQQVNESNSKLFDALEGASV